MLILLFSGNFSYTYWFLCNLLLYLHLATDLWWVSVILNLIWPLLTDIGLIFKFLIFSPWKITFCWKNILSDTFSRGYPVWKCELWLDLSNKTQKYNSAGCDHELHIVGEQPTDYNIITAIITPDHKIRDMIFYISQLPKQRENRNTAWLRDTVRQTSRGKSAAAGRTAGPPRPLTSRGTSAWPYRVTTLYSFYPVQIYS